jgi:hypothetical protein
VNGTTFPKPKPKNKVRYGSEQSLASHYLTKLLLGWRVGSSFSDAKASLKNWNSPSRIGYGWHSGINFWH